MNQSIEREIKNQYAKFFLEEDWSIFKSTAEFYLENASKVLTKDINFSEEYLKLLRRNVQKRLYIGIACELLLKAFYLKNGYCINKPKKHTASHSTFPYEMENIDQGDFKDDDTITFNKLMEKLYTIKDFGKDKQIIDKGLRIAKVFRNKEGHVVVLWHEYDPQNYRDIENSLIAFYKIAFSENLKLKFSVGNGEKAIFEIQK
jgi:hypothetical protein